MFLFPGFLAACLLGVLLSSARAQEIQHFQSGGREIAVEEFQSTAPGPRPALLVLHGAGGLTGGNGLIRQFAPAFAALGIDTFVIHYFDRTGDTWVDDAAIPAKFESWLSTLSDAVTFVANQPGVDPTRIATFGYSLGAYLGIALAARDSRIRALVEVAGGIDPTYAAKTVRMPPTLILHGEADHRVKVDRAKELQALLKKIGATYEMQLYPGEGHLLSQASAFDALTRGVAFLQRQLALNAAR